jgi:hypothetical protein
MSTTSQTTQKCRISSFMIDVLGYVYINYCNHASKMSIVLEYVYSSSMYCYREESFVDGSFLFKDMNKSTPFECMPIHVRVCVDPSNPSASSEIRPYLHKLKVMMCQLHTSPLIDISRFTANLSWSMESNFIAKQVQCPCASSSEF